MKKSPRILLPQNHSGMKFYYFVFQNLRAESGSELDEEARRAEQNLNATYSAATISENPAIKSWLALYARMGLDIRKTKPASLAMAERILRGKSIPKINPIVDIANIVMMRTLVPVGGFDFEKIDGSITLRVSEAGDQYVPLFETKPISIPPGEIVYADDLGVFSRYSKDADRTKVTNDTTEVFFVIDGTPEITDEELEAAARIMKGLVARVSPQSAVLASGLVRS